MTTSTTAARPQATRAYQNPVYDAARWAGFSLRAGDVLVCTPPKCGTTWTQMICALLIHQSPALPQPLTKLSRWIERRSEPIEDVAAELEAQPWRRVLKTHTPFDGLPYLETASYVVCLRDPRDAFLSMLDHFGNLAHSATAEAADGKLPFPTEPNALFPIWQTQPDQPWTEYGFPIGSVGDFAKTFWAWRALPNVYFLHYADLTGDLDGEMRRLAGFLGVAVDEAVWPKLVEAATFAAMKAKADEAAPGAHFGEWRSNDDFFRSARMGEWRAVLSPENQALYERLSTERLAPQLKAWLEGGRGAFDPAAALG
jgi:hypothetical protein